MDSNDVEAQEKEDAAANNSNTAEGEDTVDSTTQSASNEEPEAKDGNAEDKTSKDKNLEDKTAVEETVKGDPEVAPIYVKRLVPVFANTFQNSLIPSVKKATLSILKKMIHSIPNQMMEEVVSGNVASQLVDVIAIALSVEVGLFGLINYPTLFKHIQCSILHVEENNI